MFLSADAVSFSAALTADESENLIFRATETEVVPGPEVGSEPDMASKIKGSS